MSNKVKISPSLPFPITLNTTQDVANYLQGFLRSLVIELQEHAQRLNTMLSADGTETPSAPVMFKSYLKTALPAAATYTGGMIFVTNDAGGSTPAFSDGTNWRRVADRAIIS